MVSPLWKTVWWFLKILKIELPYNPAISLLAIYTKELKAGSQRGICTPMLIAALFTITKMLKKPKCPLMGGWIYERNVVYTYNGILFSLKKGRKI